MNKRRRFFIIFASVGVGSLISLYLIQKRMGTLSKQEYINLGFNFFFCGYGCRDFDLIATDE
ncbi:MAG: hypothetical protein IPN88_14825 [Bacteroidetes bacterium]|nr:hypothetical protein [Bacteroidota bacterium]